MFSGTAHRSCSAVRPLRAIAIVVLACLSACATSPLGRTQLILYSEQDMQAMGQAAFAALRREKAQSKSASVNAYVECVASAVTRHVAAPGVRWEVAVFDDPAVNAFALPGGKIGVYTGLLDVAESQHQLATVIGHEIGHVIAAHANERMSASTLSEVGMQVVSVIAGEPSRQRDTALAALGLGVQVGVLLPFSRTQEEEADLIGLDLMARAGFDPRESVLLWRNMERQKKGSPPEFLSTHPSSAARISALENRMPSAVTLYDAARARGIRPACRAADTGEGGGQ